MNLQELSISRKDVEQEAYEVFQIPVSPLKPSRLLKKAKWKWVEKRFSFCFDSINRQTLKIPTDQRPRNWSGLKFKKWQRENPLQVWKWKDNL